MELCDFEASMPGLHSEFLGQPETLCQRERLIPWD